MTRTRVLLAIAVALFLTAGACGIPADDSPRAIDRDDHPTATTVARPGTTDDGQTFEAELYFTLSEGDRLVTVQREVPASGAASPSPATVLGNLLLDVQPGDQPTVGDVDDIVTRIPADTALARQPTLAPDGTLTIDLNPVIQTAQGDGARLAHGQLVCTADALGEVQGVLFAVEGERVGAPTGEGDNVRTPLTCDDYSNLLDTTRD
jgi:spore germination protein GerM